MQKLSMYHDIGKSYETWCVRYVFIGVLLKGKSKSEKHRTEIASQKSRLVSCAIVIQTYMYTLILHQHDCKIIAGMYPYDCTQSPIYKIVHQYTHELWSLYIVLVCRHIHTVVQPLVNSGGNQYLVWCTCISH